MQKERDSLLEEKEAWSKSAAPSTTEGIYSAQVLRERDEALANCKVCRPLFIRIRLSIRPTESTGAGEPVEDPVEEKIHGEREQWPLFYFVTAH